MIYKKAGDRVPTGIRIKEIRLQKGYTQKQLGDLCGIADSNIRKYESGKQNPKIETLQKIADALGVPLYELLHSNEVGQSSGMPVYNIDLTGYNQDEVQQALAQIQKNLSSKHSNSGTLLNKLRSNESETIADTGEKELLCNYRQLNDEGKKQAIIRIEELTEIPKYKQIITNDLPITEITKEISGINHTDVTSTIKNAKQEMSKKSQK